jgi:hypothetical protein
LSLPDSALSGISSLAWVDLSDHEGEGSPMLLGRNGMRVSLAFMAMTLLFAAGCSVIPQSKRFVPQPADIKTRTEPAEPTVSIIDATPLDEAKPRHAFDALDDISPLPPALLKSADIPLGLATAPPIPADNPSDLAVRRASFSPNDVEPVDEISKLPRGDSTNSSALLPPVNNKPETTSVSPIGTASAPAIAVDTAAMPQAPPVVSVAPVAVTPALSPAPEPPPVVKRTPEETWREGVQTLRGIARDHLKESPKDIKPGSPNWAIRERLLTWLAEPDIDPDARSAADVAQGRAVLKGLAALLDHQSNKVTRGSEIREAITTLEAEVPLEIADLRLCRAVNGFGNIEPLEPATRKPGQAVILYCELNGLAYEPMGPSFRSRVSGEVKIFVEGAAIPAWTHPLGTAEDTCRRRRRDYFVGHKFNLPENLAPGNYRLVLTEKDLVTDQVTTKETVLAIAK